MTNASELTADERKVCNAALIKLGASAVEFSREGIVRTLLTTHYTDWVCSELSRFPWSFAMRRAELTLAPDANDRADAFAYRYNRPQDFIRLPSEDSSLEVTGAYIYAHEQPKTITYIRMADVADWIPSFRDLIGWRIALEMYRVVAQTGLSRNDIQRDYAEALSRAVREDGVLRSSVSVAETAPARWGTSWLDPNL